MALDELEIARAVIVLHWIGVLLGLGSAAVADGLGVRMLLSRARTPGRLVFQALHYTIALALLLLICSGTALIVLRMDQWCSLPENVLRLGPVCLPYKVTTKLVLMLTLVGVALLIDAYLLPLSHRTSRPLLPNLAVAEVVRAAAIGAASLTCWISLAAIPAFKALHAWPPLELLKWIAGVWLVVAALMAIGLATLRFVLRREATEPEKAIDPLAAAAKQAVHVTPRQPMVPRHELLRLVGKFGEADLGNAAIIKLPRSQSSNPPVAPADRATANVAEIRTTIREKKAQVTVQAAFTACANIMLGALAISFVVNALMLTGPLYMLQVYDRVLTSRSMETLTVLTILIVGLFAVTGMLDQIRARIMSRIAVRIDRMLAAPLLAAATKVAPLTARAGNPQPLRDLDQIRQFVAGPAMVTLLDLPWAPIYFGIVFLLHPVLGLLALAGAAVLIALSIVNHIMTRRPLVQSLEGSARCDAMVESGWRGSETLRALGMADAFQRRWLDEHARSLKLHQRANDRASTIGAATRTSRMLLQSLLLGTGAYLALHDAVSPGAMIAASIIAARALAPVEQIAAHWRGIGAFQAAVQRCRLCLASSPVASTALELPAPESRLTVSNLYVAAIGSSEPVIKGLNFQLEPGDALAVIGPSAAGKSTLARALVGVWPLRHGEIRLDGASLNQWHPDELGRYIGYLPQDPTLFEGTIAENIARLDPNPDPQAVLAAARAAGVHEMILRLEQGYATRVGEAGAGMPGGQRQRIALARALYGDPPFVVMDEPNAHLDAKGEEALGAAIGLLRRKGRIVIVIAHRRNVLASVNQVLVLNDGRQVAFGPAAKILRPKTASKQAEVKTDKRAAADRGTHVR